MRTQKQIVLIMLIAFVLGGVTAAQDVKHLKSLNKGNQRVPAQTVFSQIEEAVSSGDVKALTPYLAPQTYFSLSNGKTGYFSSNQAFYILEDFFNLYRVISFRLVNIQTNDSSPYATGVYGYELKGKRENAQVYISLKYAGKSWQISQITIN